jgi:predicted RNA binding protein YcfA (HicA-like mRNA interferase family)
MKSFNSRELIRLVEAHGWAHVETTGSHNHFKHPDRPGKMTIPHPKKDFPAGTVRSILHQAGISLRQASEWSGS